MPVTRIRWTTLWLTVACLLLVPAVALANERRPAHRAASSRSSSLRDFPSSVEKMGKLNPRAARLAENGTRQAVDVIVGYHEMPDASEDRRVRSFNGQVMKRFSQLKMRSVRIPADRLEQMSRSARVKFVALDSSVEAFSDAASGCARLPKQGDSNFTVADSYLGVAVIDSGVDTHDDLRLRKTINIIPPYGNCDDDSSDDDSSDDDSSDDHCERDPYGHGTHVAGIIAGDGDESDGEFTGFAPGTGIYSLRVLDENGRGVASDVIAALDWVLANAANYNIRVVNLSIGKAVEESAATDPLVQAAEAVWDAGIVVVTAAGNYGRDGNFTITSPGNSPKVITVGSVTDKGSGTDFSDDFTSTYSSQGPTLIDHYLKPDLIAPGNRVISTIPDDSVLAEGFRVSR